MTTFTAGKLTVGQPRGRTKIEYPLYPDVPTLDLLVVAQVRKYKANAERLALCWNTHDGLVAASEAALFHLDHQVSFEGSAVVRDLIAALAAAKGEPAPD